jgi:hypothetical protein
MPITSLFSGARRAGFDTWAWLDCRWQVISAQITTLPP